jgi:glucose/mannose-6-phosphate isomerase
LPEQFETVIEQGLDLPAKYMRSYRNIVVTGLGGSAIGGDILRSYAQSRAEVPVLVNRDYSLPAFINSESLVLAVSYSGNTEETLSSTQAALDKGAAVIAVTSGGKLADLANRHECAVVTIPGGMSPRAATGYLFTPLAMILAGLEIIPDPIKDIRETITILKTIREESHPGVETEKNQARQIAKVMNGQLPIIWGSSGNTETAAMRWKTQINENAKCPAYFNVFPELNHNEIVGFDVPDELLTRQVVVILKDADDHPQVAVDPLGRVDEEGRGASGGQRGGHLARDQPGLAHAGRHHPPAAGEQQADGPLEFGVQHRGKPRHRLRFQVDHPLGALKQIESRRRRLC